MRQSESQKMLVELFQFECNQTLYESDLLRSGKYGEMSQLDYVCRSIEIQNARRLCNLLVCRID